MPGYTLHAEWQKRTINTSLLANGLTNYDVKSLPR